MSQYTASSLRIAPLPRLAHLKLDRLGRFSQNHTTEELGVVLGAMFAACPNLETLSLQHGSMYAGSKKNPCVVMPLPAKTPLHSLGYEGGVTMSDDSSVNPRFYNWNAVYVKYCDGASFTGNKAEPVPTSDGTSIYFRGALIFEAVLQSLVNNQRLHQAKEIILSGCSAGGLAVYHHCDALADTFSGTSVKCLADAGYLTSRPCLSPVMLSLVCRVPS
jgi:hypothetical protein